MIEIELQVFKQAGSLPFLNHDDIYILQALFELFLFSIIQNDAWFSILLILEYEDETKNGMPLQAFGVHKIKVASIRKETYGKIRNFSEIQKSACKLFVFSIMLLANQLS